MKILGLIGGIGPESTIEYYRLLVAGYRERAGGEYPHVIINSVDLQRLINWMTTQQLDKAADYLVSEIAKLANAGANFAALASNTPHIVFDELKRRSALPLISIVEATCEHSTSLGLRTVGLFGTRFTMQAGFYNEVCARAGIKIVLPNDDEQQFIHDKYMNELLNNQFLPQTKAQLLDIANRLRKEHNIEALILGGTELPLLLADESYEGLKLLDTTRIHVQRLLREIFSE